MTKLINEGYPSLNIITSDFLEKGFGFCKMSYEKFKNTLWRFIRNDSSIEDFERWLYSTPNLEQFFGKTFYMEIIEPDYRKIDNVIELRERLEEFARKKYSLKCECITIRNLEDLGMGDERANPIFSTLERVADRGKPWWWLYLSKCKVCSQFWLIAQEERQNDVFFFKRLLEKEGKKILEKQIWPEDFNTYESLLKLGKERNHSVWFGDPLNSSMVGTMEDLVLARPSITLQEMADLLAINIRLARQIAKKVNKEGNVKIPL